MDGDLLLCVGTVIVFVVGAIILCREEKQLDEKMRQLHRRKTIDEYPWRDTETLKEEEKVYKD